MAGGAFITVVGFVGKEPIKRVVSNDYTCTSFPIACDNGYNSDSVIWFEAVAFGAVGEVCAKHLHRGEMVFITGKFRRDEWVDKETGILRSRDKIELQNIRMLNKPRFAEMNNPMGEATEPEMDFVENPTPQNVAGDNPPSFDFDPSAAKRKS